MVIVPISTLGGWHRDAFRMVRKLAEKVAIKTIEAVQKACSALLERHTVQLILSNAASLLAGVLVIEEPAVNKTCEMIGFALSVLRQI